MSNYDKFPDAIARSNKVLYGVIADSCLDNNYWCRRDPMHIDISKSYLESVYGSIGLWNNRFVSWSYISGAPPGYVQPLCFASSGFVLAEIPVESPPKLRIFIIFQKNQKKYVLDRSIQQHFT